MYGQSLNVSSCVRHLSQGKFSCAMCDKSSVEVYVMKMLHTRIYMTNGANVNRSFKFIPRSAPRWAFRVDTIA